MNSDFTFISNEITRIFYLFNITIHVDKLSNIYLHSIFFSTFIKLCISTKITTFFILINRFVSFRNLELKLKTEIMFCKYNCFYLMLLKIVSNGNLIFIFYYFFSFVQEFSRKNYYRKSIREKSFFSNIRISHDSYYINWNTVKINLLKLLLNKI